MKQNLLKTIAIGLLAMVGVNAWGQTNLLSADGISISAKQSNSELADANKVLSEGTLTLKSLAASELTLYLTFDAINIDVSKCYVILETSQGIFNTSGTYKLRNITLDSYKFDRDGSNKSLTTYNSHDVMMMSPASNGMNKATINSVATPMLTYYASHIDETMSFTSLGFNIPVSTAGNVTIYRVGLYDIAEIESLYGNPAIRFVDNQTSGLRIEFSGDANTVKVKNNTITMKRDEAAVLIKSIGALPNTYSIVDLRGLTISDTETAKPLNYETMSNLSNVTKVLMGSANYMYFPTMNENVYILGSKYVIYKDGKAPSTFYNSADGLKEGNGNSGRYYSYARNFKKNYNTCILPFQLDFAKIPDGLSVYTFTSAEGGVVTFSKLTEGSIAYNTPFIVKADKAGICMFSQTHGTGSWNEGKDSGYEKYWSSATSNDITFVGTYESKVPDGTWAAGANSTNYGITSDGTKVAKMKATGASTDTKTTYYRAFISDKRTNAPALSVSFNDLENGTTDIVSMKDVHGLEIISDGAIYNLQGVRMNGDNLPKGIYVKNGRKFVVK